jgi:aldose 1-epimerase
MAAEVRLASGPAEATVRREGALVARFAVAGLDVLHPADGPGPGGCFPLVPWSNRISGGGFSVGSRFHALEPNAPGEPFPIHGNGWQSTWTLEPRSAARAVLRLDSDGPGPFRYRARLLVALAPRAVTLVLAVTNRAPEPLPYGLGFHPSFVRRAGMTLAAPAATVWLEDARHLPTVRLAVADRPAWDFSAARPLPASWINNAFEGWSGRASLDDAAVRRRVVIAARALRTLVLYSPDAAAPFVCVEPVSHAADAHNREGMPGLAMLRPGDTAAAALRIAVADRP